MAQDRESLDADPIDWDRLDREREKQTSAQAKGNGAAATSPTLHWTNTSSWDTEPCPQREWAVPDRVPINQVTLFSGEGAVGKSILELMLSVAHVTGKDWLQSLPELGSAFYIGCEDDEKEMHIRLHSIIQHYGTTFTDLQKGGFRCISLAGQDAIMAAPDRNGIVRPTTLFDQIYEQAGDLKPKHIGIDTSADVFAGDEINRAQVRQFINLLRKLAIVAHGSVVLLSHPSLTGISTGTGLSGSTAWHNSVRARMYMTAPKTKSDDDEPANSDLREMIFKKSNYSRIADSLVLRYKNGLFLPEAGKSDFEKAAHEAAIEKTFIALAKKLEARGIELSPSPKSHSYAPKLMIEEPEAKKIKKTDLATAIDRLLEKGAIQIETLRAGTAREKKIIKRVWQGEETS